MSFTSLTFIFLFFPVSVIGYLVTNKINHKLGTSFLVLAGLVFYSWDSWKATIAILVLCIYLYFAGKIIEKKKSKKLLIVSIVLMVGLLLFFKYFNYGIRVINILISGNINSLGLIMPIGFSFIVFESISYLVDIYKGEKSGSLMDVLFFITFFPKIISGPIVLWKNFNKELNNQKISIDAISSGIERIIIGISKKVIIADVLGKVVSDVLANMNGVDSSTMLLCCLAYMIEIYYDFSGYSDIAIGLCSVFGFHVEENFNFPYLSQSIGEFFRRWHISLGAFLKEYIYIPLGGNRNGNVYFNLFMVFLISGIWHGNSAAYIVWGILCGVFVCIERFLGKKDWYKKVHPIIKWAVTMVITYFLWMLFMTSSISETENVISIIFNGSNADKTLYKTGYYFDNRIIFTMIIGIVGSLYNARGLYEKMEKKFNNNKVLYLIKTLVILFLFAVSFVYIVNSTYSPFIYFRF